MRRPCSTRCFTLRAITKRSPLITTLWNYLTTFLQPASARKPPTPPPTDRANSPTMYQFMKFPRVLTGSNKHPSGRAYPPRRKFQEFPACCNVSLGNFNQQLGTVDHAGFRQVVNVSLSQGGTCFPLLFLFSTSKVARIPRRGNTLRKDEISSAIIVPIRLKIFVHMVQRWIKNLTKLSRWKVSRFLRENFSKFSVFSPILEELGNRLTERRTAFFQIQWTPLVRLNKHDPPIYPWRFFIGNTGPYNSHTLVPSVSRSRVSRRVISEPGKLICPRRTYN